MQWITWVQHNLRGIWLIFCKFSKNSELFAIQLKCIFRIPGRWLCWGRALCLGRQQTLRMDYLTLKIIYKFPNIKWVLFIFTCIFAFWILKKEKILFKSKTLQKYHRTDHRAPTSAMNLAYNKVSFLFYILAMAINDPRLTMMKMNPKKNLRM